MKALKKIVALFTAALFILLPIFSNTITAQAEENPVTYYLKYVDADQEWRYQLTSWDANDNGRELYYMQLNLKDGDIIVIDSNTHIDLTVNVRLSNLTIVNGTAVVAAKSIDNFYLLNNQTAAINGDVTNAYVYHYGIANFNSNVTNLYIACEKSNDDPDATVVALGTVAHLKAYDADSTYYEYYNFKANTLNIDRGTLTTASDNFSTTASAATTTPAVSTTPTTTTTSSAGELDDVPKTGDFRVSPLWFLGIAAVCLLGYRKLERK